MISRDSKVLDSSSRVFERMQEYAGLFERLDVVVMGRVQRNVKYSNSERLCIHNATSIVGLLSFCKTFFKVYGIARKSKNADTWISSQDPFESGLIATMVAKLLKTRLQLQFHTDCFSAQYVKQRVVNYLRAILARILVTRADSIRVVSERIKRTLEKIKLKSDRVVRVLPIWTDIQSIVSKPVLPEWNLRERFPEFKKIILIVARLENEKNIGLSLLSFKKILRFDQNIGLVIAGEGGKSTWLKSLTKSLDIESSVRYIGWVDDTSSLYKTADLLLVTSLYEGYGLNMVEAVACGCPVVSTDVGVAPDLNAVIVPYDAGQIALTTIQVLKQDKRVEIAKEFIVTKQGYLERFKNTFIV